MNIHQDDFVSLIQLCLQSSWLTNYWQCDCSFSDSNQFQTQTNDESTQEKKLIPKSDPLYAPGQCRTYFVTIIPLDGSRRRATNLPNRGPSRAGKPCAPINLQNSNKEGKITRKMKKKNPSSRRSLWAPIISQVEQRLEERVLEVRNYNPSSSEDMRRMKNCFQLPRERKRGASRPTFKSCDWVR